MSPAHHHRMPWLLSRGHHGKVRTEATPECASGWMITAHRRLSPKRQACIYVGMANLTEFSLHEAIAVLTRTPATLDALLRGLPDIWVRCNEGKDTWNAFDIVGHLIVGERTDWMPRGGV